MSPALADPRREYARLLRRPRYPGFVLTVSLARTCSTMFNTAGVLLVLARTGSAALAGATAAAAVLPGALSGPVLGAWLDVADRRRVLIVFDQLLSAAALVAIVALAGHAPAWTLLAVAFVYSVTRPFSTGSFYSALAEIAGPELLDQASAIEASSLNLSFVVGPALAGALAGAVGPATAVEVQAAVTVIVAALVAINPVFEARSPERAISASDAIRTGMRSLTRDPVLSSTGAAAALAAFGWGLMTIGFPLYAARLLGAGAHAGGYLWAAMALGSTVGTFVLAGRPSLRRIGLSYGVLGLSALLWPLAHTLVLGILLIGLTGFLEGPAYSGTIALRQRHTPPAVRAQVMTTLTGVALVASSAGAAISGAIDRPIPAIVAFTVINVLAALTAARGRMVSDGSD
ncbi:MAG TPA: MFS transporter [Solirubrobacteraceae bacterium]